MSALASIDRSEISPTTLLRLEVAAQIKFPDGSITLSSLRREARRGRLTIWRVANKDMTTLAEIDRMTERCLVRKDSLDCGFDPHEADDRQPTSFSMTDVKSAQVAAKMRVERLKKSSNSTLPENETQPRIPNVVLIKPR